jgi:hypothetical protein
MVGRFADGYVVGLYDFFTILTLFAELERLLLSPLLAAAISRQPEEPVIFFFGRGSNFREC